MSDSLSFKPTPYPQHVSEFADIDKLIETSVLCGYSKIDLLSDPQSIIVTQGSCFARNIANSFVRMGIRAAHLNVNEYINTTFANAIFFDYILNEGECNPAIVAIFSERVPSTSAAIFRQVLSTCRAFILTIGVAPCWFVRGTNNMVLEPNKRKLHEYEMRTTTVDQNADNIRRIIALIQRANPEVQIFLTLSPAPLNYSFEMPSTVVADCVSKSTLRVAIHQVMSQNITNVRYWPSFEVVRWIGSHIGPTFGNDDDHPRHVSAEIVDHITRAFIRLHNGQVDGQIREIPAEFDNVGPFMLAKNF